MTDQNAPDQIPTEADRLLLVDQAITAGREQILDRLREMYGVTGDQEAVFEAIEKYDASMHRSLIATPLERNVAKAVADTEARMADAHNMAILAARGLGYADGCRDTEARMRALRIGIRAELARRQLLPGQRTPWEADDGRMRYPEQERDTIDAAFSFLTWLVGFLNSATDENIAAGEET